MGLTRPQIESFLETDLITTHQVWKELIDDRKSPVSTIFIFGQGAKNEQHGPKAISFLKDWPNKCIQQVWSEFSDWFSTKILSWTSDDRTGSSDLLTIKWAKIFLLYSHSEHQQHNHINNIIRSSPSLQWVYMTVQSQVSLFNRLREK